MGIFVRLSQNISSEIIGLILTNFSAFIDMSVGMINLTFVVRSLKWRFAMVTN